MSAGGALAAIIGVRFPGLVSAVAVHSGIACGAASSAVAALAVMQRGPDQDVEQIASAVRAQRRRVTLRVPLLAVHGSADQHRGATQRDGAGAAIPAPQRSPGGERDTDPTRCRPPIPNAAIELAGGRTEVVSEWRRDGSSRRASYRDRGPRSCVERRRSRAGVQRRGAAGCHSAGRRFLRRCIILTARKEENRWPFPE